jgi:hypothetical protein
MQKGWPQALLRPALGIGVNVSESLERASFSAAGSAEIGSIVGELFAGFAHTCAVVADFLAVLSDLVFAGAGANVTAQFRPVIFQLALLSAQLLAAVANLFALGVDRCRVFGECRRDPLIVIDRRADVPAAMLVRRNRRASTRIVEVTWIAVMVVPVAVRGAAADVMGVMALMVGIGVAVVLMFALAMG